MSNILEVFEYKSRKGKPFSEEHRRKISESLKGYHKGRTWQLVDGKRVWIPMEVK